MIHARNTTALHEVAEGRWQANPIGMLIVDHKGIVRLANPAAATILGKPAAGMLGSQFDVPIAEPHGTSERKVHRQDEQPGMVEMRTRHVTWDDGPATFVSIRDITTAKSAEQALIARTEAMERANAELERFAYIASHDLQEPLRSVKGYVDLLSIRHGSTLADEAAGFLRSTSNAVGRMEQLIDDLLTYSRLHIEDVTRQPVDTAELVREVCEQLKDAVETAGAVVDVGPLPVVRGLRPQLRRLFENLIDNAIKFRGADPPHVSVRASDRGREWAFWVRDNGIGIASENLGRVFDVFERLHLRSQFAGNGIGLAICRRTVELHDGKIRVESQPGVGSTFRFTLASS